MDAYRLSLKAAADVEGIYAYTIEQHGLTLARKYLDGLACLLRASRGAPDARPPRRPYRARCATA